MSLAGEYIDAYCPRCELLLAHIVLFEVGGTVSRVKCRTCGTEHKYRGQKPERKRTLSGPGSHGTGKSRETAAQKAGHPVDMERWQSNRNQMGPDTEVMKYRMSERYGKGDVIDHDTFGLGFVEKIISENRLDILFEDGVRRMAMNMKTPE
jgi:hypothetical protein